MPKKKTNPDEQLDLIEIGPEHAPEITKTAKAYKEAVGERLAWLALEKKYKAELLALAKAEKLTPLEGGVIKFSVDGYIITIVPRDEKITVKPVEDTE